jgi:hypothetical protein
MFPFSRSIETICNGTRNFYKQCDQQFQQKSRLSMLFASLDTHGSMIRAVRTGPFFRNWRNRLRKIKGKKKCTLLFGLQLAAIPIEA